MIVNPQFSASVTLFVFGVVAIVSVLAACWLAVSKPDQAYFPFAVP
jgi:hypothetical protein